MTGRSQRETLTHVVVRSDCTWTMTQIFSRHDEQRSQFPAQVWSCENCSEKASFELQNPFRGHPAPTLIHTNQLCCAFHSTQNSAVISTQRSTRVWKCRRCLENSRFSFLFRRMKILSRSVRFFVHRVVLVPPVAVETSRTRIVDKNLRFANNSLSLGLAPLATVSDGKHNILDTRFPPTPLKIPALWVELARVSTENCLLNPRGTERAGRKAVSWNHWLFFYRPRWL